MRSPEPVRFYDDKLEYHYNLETETSEYINMGKDEQRSIMRPEGRRGDAVAHLAALISISVLVSVTWLIVLFSNPASLSWFAFHPPLQSLAIGLFTYGILTLQPTSQPKTKAAGLTRHQLYMLLTGLPVVLIGTWAIYHNKNLNRKPHFTTWHGTFGIVSILWMVGQILLGGGSVWYGGAAFGGSANAKSLWKYHRLSGYLLYPLFLITAHSGGAWSSFSTSHSSDMTRLVTYTMGPVVALVAVYSRARLSKMQFF